MTPTEAIAKGFTHHAEMYGISGYIKFEGEGMEFQVKYILTEYIWECILYLDSIIGFSPYGFMAKVKGELI